MLQFSSIPTIIGFRYAVWLIDVIFVDGSSARHHHKRISDMDAGSHDLRSFPQQEVRDCQNAAQDQPKTAGKRPKRRQEGPKRAPRRAPKGPKTGPRRPCARWAGGFKWLAPFRRPPEGLRARDDRGSHLVGFVPGLYVRRLWSLRWDLVVRLSGAFGQQF